MLVAGMQGGFFVADRIARLIERLLDQADVAAESADWPTVADACRRVLAADPSNTDALALLQMAGTETSDAGLTVAGPLGERRIVTVLFADAVKRRSMSSFNVASR